MILSKNEIFKAIRSGRLAITPFKKENVGACSVDLTLGNEFKVFKKSKNVLEVNEGAEAGPAFAKRVKLKPGQQIILKPGELVLGITSERLRLADNLIGHLEGRSRFARLGLLVHVSSSLIQPGVDNVQVLEMANLAPHPLALKPGLRLCQVVFEEVKGSAHYEGRFKRQGHI